MRDEFCSKLKLTGDIDAKRFLKMAYEQAYNFSQDPSTKTGAVVVSPDLEVIGQNFNYIPKEITECFSDDKIKEKLSNRDWKIKYMVHSEPSAIFDTMRKKNNLEGATMYMPWFPCSECAEEIVYSGISCLVGHKQMIERTPKNWDKSLTDAFDILHGKVDLFVYDGKIGGVENLMRGEIWYP